jgi:methylase of polypeptide subunit release factors
MSADTINLENQACNVIKQQLKQIKSDQIMEALLALVVDNPTHLGTWARHTKALIKEVNLNHLLKHKLTDLLEDQSKATLGKYFTPPPGVELVKGLIQNILPNSLVVDLSVGFGAFTTLTDPSSFMGFDIDTTAIKFTSEILGYKAQATNSVETIGREALGIPKERDLIVVGNPPYNDQTSKNRRQLKTKLEQGQALVADRDMGIAFLKAAFHLQPKAVCFLHPFSYILKYANYARLAKQGYYPYKLIIFSSRLFSTHGSNAFPCVAALWMPRTQPAPSTSAEIRQEHQEILTKTYPAIDLSVNPSSQFSFCANNYVTIDQESHKIPKYANKAASDINIYQYTIRDLNSLLASGNLTNKQGNTIPLLISEPNTLFQYAALNVMRRYWKLSQKPVDFILGNLSPIYPATILSYPLNYYAVLDTMVNNRKTFAGTENEILKICRAASNPLLDQALNEFENPALGNQASSQIKQLLVSAVTNLR